MRSNIEKRGWNFHNMWSQSLGKAGWCSHKSLFVCVGKVFGCFTIAEQSIDDGKGIARTRNRMNGKKKGKTKNECVRRMNEKRGHSTILKWISSPAWCDGSALLGRKSEKKIKQKSFPYPWISWAWNFLAKKWAKNKKEKFRSTVDAI